MIFGLERSLVLGTYMFGVVQLRHSLIGQMKRNWMKEQLDATLLIMLNALRALSFIIPQLDHFLRQKNARFFEDVEFGREDNIRSIVFEEKQENNQDQDLIPDVVFCPNIALDNAQTILPNIVQDVVIVQDNNEVLQSQDNIDQVILPDIVPDDASSLNNNEVLPQEPIVQTQQPQEVPLRRSTRERRSVILDDYIVFLQEHEVNVNLAENGLINLQQALQSSNSHKWTDAMKDEMKSMEDNDVWDIVEFPKGSKPISCKWIFKTREIQMLMSKDIKLA